MGEPSSKINMKKYAVVTGANKGIGFEVCRQLASQGITVVLTARDEKRGLEAVEKLKNSGIPDDYVTFHQLDVSDSENIASFAESIKSQFGKLDILVNNAGISGATIDVEKFRSAMEASKGLNRINLDGVFTQSYEQVKHCLETNYYGAKRLCEALITLLQRSDSPRIVNVSSASGKLKNIPNEWAKKTLREAEEEENIDQVLNEFLKDFKENKNNLWPLNLSAYTLSKAAMNAYTKIIAKRYNAVKINSVCPGFVKTDINFNLGTLPVEEGAENVVRVALTPDDGPSGSFIVQKEVFLEDY